MYPRIPLLPTTTSDKGAARLPVDVGSTGFFLGREFRFFYDFSIPVGESRWIRVTAPIDCTLKLQSLTSDQGAVRFRAWRNATSVGPWTAPASPTSGWFDRNQPAADARGYTGQVIVELGGNGAATTASAICSEVVRVRTAGATAQRTTVGQNLATERVIPADTYHLEIANVDGTGAAVGTYTFNLEERVG